MREDLLKELEDEFNLIRTENERTEILRKEEIRRMAPEIHQLVQERESLVFSTLRSILSKEKTDAGSLRRYELNGNAQVGVVVIGSIRKVEHQHPDGPVAVEVECLTGRHAVALPIDQSFTLCHVKRGERVGKEICV